MSVLRINSDRLGEVQEIVNYLQIIEDAYNNIYAFELIVKEAKSRHEESEPISWKHVRGTKKIRGLRRIRRVLDVVVPEDKLRLRSVVVQSPGFWEFLGALNPLEVLRKYLSDRHERKKDIDYRNKLEAEKKSLENEKLYTEVVQEKLELLRNIGVPEDKIREVFLNHVVNPLKRLDAVQDSGLLQDAIIIHNKENNAMSKTFSRSDIYVSKNLAPPFSTVIGVDSEDFGYTAEYNGYSAVGDGEDEAIDKLVDKLVDKGYVEV